MKAKARTGGIDEETLPWRAEFAKCAIVGRTNGPFRLTCDSVREHWGKERVMLLYGQSCNFRQPESTPVKGIEMRTRQQPVWNHHGVMIAS